MYASTESEGKRRRHQVDTVVEGIGLNRITKNFSEALPFIDDAYSSVLTLAFIDLTDDGWDRVTDEEAVAMSRHLAQVDGLFLGSSAAVNLVTCVRLAQKYGAGSGKVIVTILWSVQSHRPPHSHTDSLTVIPEHDTTLDSGRSLSPPPFHSSLIRTEQERRIPNPIRYPNLILHRFSLPLSLPIITPHMQL
jgi:hypothetical protein